MKCTKWILAAAASLAAVSCRSESSGHHAGRSGHEAEEHEDDDRPGDEQPEEQVALSAVPEAATAAATRAFPGFALREATKELEDGRTVFTLEGLVDGVEYEIEVTAEGRILEANPADDADE